MPEAQDIPGAMPPAEPGRRRNRRRRKRPFVVRYWWLIPLGLLAVAVPLLWNMVTTAIFKKEPLPGYITSMARIEQEYLQYTGKPLQDNALERQFDQATETMLNGNFANAAIILEDAAKRIAVPAVFNNIGLLYLKINDGPHAVRAFRDALARDHDYQPVRANLKRLNLTTAVDPSASELEPNNSNLEANAVWLDRPVDATISPSVGDMDCYWFITPRPPRDRLAIEVLNRSVTLVPHLRVYDSDGKLLSGLREATSAGESVRFDFSPPPNGYYIIQVEGANGTSGAYVLTISSLRAYDVYEPNDDILNATRISPGQTIEANIMDGDDTDFFSFISPAASSVTIDITPRDKTLVPGLSTFAPDLRSTGFGPEVDQPGAAMHYVMKVQPNQVYSIQVWGKANSTGAYSLVLK